MDNRLLMSAFVITLVFIGGLFMILARLGKRGPVPPPEPEPESNSKATIQRVLSTEKLDRHELRINLLLEVQPLKAASYESEVSWVIRVGRIVGMQPGQSFPVEIAENGAVSPLLSWAKLWREGYTPPPRD